MIRLAEFLINLKSFGFPHLCQRMFLLDHCEKGSGIPIKGIHRHLDLGETPKCDYLLIRRDSYSLIEESDIAAEERNLLKDGFVVPPSQNRKHRNNLVNKKISSEMRGKALSSLLALYNLHAKFNVRVDKTAGDGVEFFRGKRLIFVILLKDTSQQLVICQNLDKDIKDGLGNLFDKVIMVTRAKFISMVEQR